MTQGLIQTKLQELSQEHPITLGKIAGKLDKKGLILLALIADLPFMQPIPIPGVSTVLGLIIILQAVSLIIGAPAYLPRGLKDKEIPQEKWGIFIKVANKFLNFLSFLKIKPRLRFLANHQISRILTGLCLVTLASFLSLPLPLPASNFLPALGIFFLCLGLLEEDGYLVILGWVYSSVFFVMLFLLSHLIVGELQAFWT